MVCLKGESVYSSLLHLKTILWTTPLETTSRKVEREDIKNFLELDEDLPEYYYLSPDNRFGAKLFEDLKDRPKYSLSHLRKTIRSPS